jgi:hypothetical protein
MSRNRVIVDGTRPGRGRPCSSRRARQDFGPRGRDARPLGRDGILIYRANGVSIENLTVCNLLGGSGYGGNGIWWNGGYGLRSRYGQIGLHGFRGAYLTATTSYYGGASTAAAYGIYASRSVGGGGITPTRATSTTQTSTWAPAFSSAT